MLLLLFVLLLGCRRVVVELLLLGCRRVVELSSCCC